MFMYLFCWTDDGGGGDAGGVDLSNTIKHTN